MSLPLSLSLRWNSTHRTTGQDIGNILGALYLAVLFLGIINSRTVQPPASYERGVMYRERAAGEAPFAAFGVPQRMQAGWRFTIVKRPRRTLQLLSVLCCLL